MNIYEGISNNLKHQQLINNIEYVIGGYANGMSDDPDSYKPMTEDELLKYCYSEIFDIKNDGEGGTRLLKGACDDLKFLGNDLIKSEILRIGEEEGVLAKDVYEDSKIKNESDNGNVIDSLKSKSFEELKTLVPKLDINRYKNIYTLPKYQNQFMSGYKEALNGEYKADFDKIHDLEAKLKSLAAERHLARRGPSDSEKEDEAYYNGLKLGAILLDEIRSDRFVSKLNNLKEDENNENEESIVGTYEVYKNGQKCNIEVKQFNNGKSKMYAVDNPFKGFEWGTNFYKTEDAVKKFLSKHDATKIRNKYYESNYDPYNQPQEVIDEINRGTCFVSNFDELLDDYESNHDSDFYIDVIKTAQTNLATRQEQSKNKDAERQYKEDKRKLAALRKNHSTNVDLIDALYNRIKKYEEEHK